MEIKSGLILFLCAIMGLLFSNVRKFIILRRNGGTIDYKFTVKNYISADWDIMLGQILSIIVALLLWSSVVLQEYPSWEKYAELIFVIFGGVGSEVLNTAMSKAEKDIIEKIKNYNSDSK